ncbi:MAG: hypothetical protein EXR62_03990 [Chloroflexi bacterium]|nr:hypothetical protein [Chloroflexota bacterium]
MRRQASDPVPQVGVGLGFAGIGPEEEGQMLAGLRSVAMQQQIGQQRLQTCGVEARHRLVAIAQVETHLRVGYAMWTSAGMSFAPEGAIGNTSSARNERWCEDSQKSMPDGTKCQIIGCYVD